MHLYESFDVICCISYGKIRCPPAAFCALWKQKSGNKTYVVNSYDYDAYLYLTTLLALFFENNRKSYKFLFLRFFFAICKTDLHIRPRILNNVITGLKYYFSYLLDTYEWHDPLRFTTFTRFNKIFLLLVIISVWLWIKNCISLVSRYLVANWQWN